MKAPLPLPPPGSGKTRLCERCGLRRPDDETKCPHCGELDDSELDALKRRVAEQHEGHSRLGRNFLIAAAVIAAIVLMLLLE